MTADLFYLDVLSINRAISLSDYRVLQTGAFRQPRSGWFRPEFSFMTGKFHYTKGLLLGLDIPQKLSKDSSLNIKYSARVNIIQTGDGNGTGWLDLGLFFGYEYK